MDRHRDELIATAPLGQVEVLDAAEGASSGAPDGHSSGAGWARVLARTGCAALFVDPSVRRVGALPPGYDWARATMAGGRAHQDGRGVLDIEAPAGDAPLVVTAPAV